MTHNLIVRRYPITSSIVAMLEHLMTIKMKYKYSKLLIELLDQVQDESLIIQDALPKFLYECEDDVRIAKTIVGFN